MASIRKVVHIDAPADRVWAALRDWGSLHRVLVPGFVTDAQLDGGDRIVTFFNGFVARERLVSSDDQARRLVYAIPEGSFEHYNGSVQVFEDGPARCRVLWLIDLLPNTLADQVRGMAEHGTGAMKQTLSQLGRGAA
jgi:hypothetical protein